MTDVGLSVYTNEPKTFPSVSTETNVTCPTNEEKFEAANILVDAAKRKEYKELFLKSRVISRIQRISQKE